MRRNRKKKEFVVQEECDTWLSTSNRKKLQKPVIPRPKSSSSVYQMLFTQTKMPVTAKKQTSIMSFLGGQMAAQADGNQQDKDQSIFEVEELHSGHVTLTDSDHVTPGVSDHVTPGESDHMTPEEIGHVTPDNFLLDSIKDEVEENDFNNKNKRKLSDGLDSGNQNKKLCVDKVDSTMGELDMNIHGSCTKTGFTDKNTETISVQSNSNDSLKKRDPSFRPYRDKFLLDKPQNEDGYRNRILKDKANCSDNSEYDSLCLSQEVSENLPVKHRTTVFSDDSYDSLKLSQMDSFKVCSIEPNSIDISESYDTLGLSQESFTGLHDDYEKKSKKQNFDGEPKDIVYGAKGILLDKFDEISQVQLEKNEKDFKKKCDANMGTAASRHTDKENVKSHSDIRQAVQPEQSENRMMHHSRKYVDNVSKKGSSQETGRSQRSKEKNSLSILGLSGFGSRRTIKRSSDGSSEEDQSTCLNPKQRSLKLNDQGFQESEFNSTKGGQQTLQNSPVDSDLGDYDTLGLDDSEDVSMKAYTCDKYKKHEGCSRTSKLSSEQDYYDTLGI